MKLFRNIIPFLVLFFLLGNGEGGLFAQAPFTERITIGSISEIASGTIMYDGGYLFGGAFGTDPKSFTTMPCLIAVDTGGAVRWVKPLGAGDDGWVTSISKSSDGAYFAAGYFRTGGASQTFILRFDTLGKTLWCRMISNSFSDQDFGLTPSADGGCFVIEQPDPEDKVHALKFRKDGSLEWGKNMAGEGFVFNAACTLIDGSFVATGYTSHLPFAAVICKWTPSGSLAWYKKIGVQKDRLDISALGITRTHDDGFVITGRTGGNFGNDVFIMKFDRDGSPLWDKFADLFESESGTSVTETSGGNILVTGNSGFTNFTDSSFNQNAILLELQGDGTLETAKILEIPKTQLTVNSILSDPSGSILITGIAIDSGEQDYIGGAFISKITARGTNCHLRSSFVSVQQLTPIITESTLQATNTFSDTMSVQIGDALESSIVDLCALSSVSDERGHGNEILLYPNPALTGSKVTIRVTEPLPPGRYELLVQDILGNQVTRERIDFSGSDREIPFDLPECAAGAYVIELHNENDPATVYRSKFVKQ